MLKSLNEKTMKNSDIILFEINVLFTGDPLIPFLPFPPSNPDSPCKSTKFKFRRLPVDDGYNKWKMEEE